MTIAVHEIVLFEGEDVSELHDISAGRIREFGCVYCHFSFWFLSIEIEMKKFYFH